ncbi:MAG: peptidoglycan DD-metalloendopeptidase family protein [Nocardioides sp.]
MNPLVAKILAALARSPRMRRWTWVAGGVAALIPVAAVLIVGWLVISLISAVITPNNTAGNELAGGACGSFDGDAAPAMLDADRVKDSLTGEQARNAGVIIGVGRKLDVPDAGIVIALATASQESGIRNIDYGDRDSLGLFQQRPSTGWGTPQEVRDPAKATAAFFGRASHTGNTGLLDIPGWQQMSLTRAAQAVQRSAFPDAYADDEPLAWRILRAVVDGGELDGVAAASTGTACTTAMIGGNVTYPLPKDSGYIDLDNYGVMSAIRSGQHTGNDYSVACGTPVLAAHPGTVVIEAGPGWFGSALVKVSTGPESLTTWYAHMQQVTVDQGAVVNAGVVLGYVGSEGNSTGCHLHFEVHPRNGSIYADDIDPAPWLAAHVGKPLSGVAQASASGAAVRVAQANVKFDLPGRAFREDLDTVASTRADFISLNEVSRRSDAEITPAGYDVWRESRRVRGDDGTAVLWRTDRWREVETGRVLMVRDGPAATDHDRAATWVTLVDGGGTTVSVVSVHHMINPARYGPAKDRRQRLYREGMIRLRELISRLSRQGPVFVAGDFNSQWSDDDPWGPRAMLGPVGMTSTMDALGRADTHDGGGAIDYIFYAASAAAPQAQETRNLNSDHELLYADFSFIRSATG